LECRLWLAASFNTFLGFSGGAYALVAPLYVSETAETSIRGGLTSMMQLMSTLGVAFVDGLNINGAVDWVTISAICISLPGTKMLIIDAAHYSFF
jgi:Zn-dependent protease